MPKGPTISPLQARMMLAYACGETTDQVKEKLSLDQQALDINLSEYFKAALGPLSPFISDFSQAAAHATDLGIQKSLFARRSWSKRERNNRLGR